MRRIAILLLVIGALLALWSMRGPRAASAVVESPAVRPQDHVLSAGDYYVVALDRQGRIFGWGGIESRTVSGERLVSASKRPRLLVAGSGYRQVSAGHRALYALDSSAALWRIDLGDIGQADALAAPLPVSPGLIWKQAFERWGIGVGIQADGSLWYWRDDALAREAEGATSIHLREPHRLMYGTRFVDACLQGARLHAVDAAGDLWRSANLKPRGWGGDGRPLQGERSGLERLSAQAGLRRVFCRDNARQVFALDGRGHLHGYGSNVFGELGIGEPKTDGDPAAADATSLAQVSDQAWASVAVAPNFTLAIARDGALWGWGRNLDNELGVGDSDAHPTPALIDASRRWAAVAATYVGATAMTTSGELHAWGHNTYGLLGEGGIARSHARPAPVLTDERFGADDGNG